MIIKPMIPSPPTRPMNRHAINSIFHIPNSDPERLQSIQPIPIPTPKTKKSPRTGIQLISPYIGRRKRPAIAKIIIYIIMLSSPLHKLRCNFSNSYFLYYTIYISLCQPNKRCSFEKEHLSYLPNINADTTTQIAINMIFSDKIHATSKHPQTIHPRQPFSPPTKAKKAFPIRYVTTKTMIMPQSSIKCSPILLLVYNYIIVCKPFYVK